MSDIDLMESVLTATADVLDGVPTGALGHPTLCTEFDVAALRDHILAASQMFTRAAGAEPSGGFREDGARTVAAWREHGTDRPVTIRLGEVPGTQAVCMTIVEFATHGCELAVATGQRVPYRDGDLEQALAIGRRTLPDRFRGPGQAFGFAVAVRDDAPPWQRLLGFAGREVGA